MEILVHRKMNITKLYAYFNCDDCDCDCDCDSGRCYDYPDSDSGLCARNDF